MINDKLIAVLVCWPLLVPLSVRAQSASDVLKKADAFRVSTANLQVDVEVQTFNQDGTLANERRYLVFTQSQRRSLVLMQSPSEKGQKVLMLGDDYWLLMPGTARPIRITPMQKLLGDASTGDIATMSWSDDYSADLVGDETCEAIACTHLRLMANSKAVSYQRIDLWIGRTHREPLKAELYVQSEKLAKTATFAVDNPAAPKEVTQMILRDQLSNRKETRVRYAARKERAIPAQWLNPMYLATNPKLD